MKPRILVVDDEPQIQRFLRPALEATDFEVETAETVAAAKRLAAMRAPALIVLDLGLPDGDGKDVIETVRAFSKVPIIVLSARDQEAEKIAAAVPNVRAVTNEIQVGGLSSMTSRANDTALTARVKGRFLNAKDFSSLHVKVVTEAAVVYLLGLVTEAEAEAATEIARTTSGVRKVVKVFDYCQSTDELCRPASTVKPKPSA